MFSQLAIAILGVTAIYLSQQWGILLVSICYAIAWATGFKNQWL